MRISEAFSDDYCCDKMRMYLSLGDVAIVYVAKLREYGLPVLDGGSSYILITHCPWCGSQLPSSLRDEWFDEIRMLGHEPEDASLPAKYGSDEWWRARKM